MENSMYILLVSLLVAAYTDYKTRTIPIWLFPLTVLLYSIQVVWTGGYIGTENILGFLCMFLPTLLLSINGKMGGGDVLMLSAIGFLLGYKLTVYVFIVSVISTLYFIIILKFKKKECPLAPFALVAYILFLILEVY